MDHDDRTSRAVVFVVHSIGSESSCPTMMKGIAFSALVSPQADAGGAEVFSTHTHVGIS